MRSACSIHRAAIVAGVAALAGCGAPRATETPRAAAPASELEVVAEGPCGRLSVQAFARRTFLVYGETGYDLHDWAVGERLAAAQSFVELRGGDAFRGPSLHEGLPVDAAGYVAADLYLGESDGEGPWLFAVETRYAARGAGRLFDRHGRVYARRGSAWVATAHESPITLPAAARSLPPLPLDTACEKPGLRFLPLASTRLASGEVLVAGRCQDASHVNTRETSVLVAHGSPGTSSWRTRRRPTRRRSTASSISASTREPPATRTWWRGSRSSHRRADVPTSRAGTARAGSSRRPRSPKG